MTNPSELSDSDYRAHWLKYHDTLDWSAFVDMTDVAIETLVAPPKGSFMERASAKHFQEPTNHGGLNSAHTRRQRYRDSIVADPFDISRVAALDNTATLNRTLGDFARAAWRAAIAPAATSVLGDSPSAARTSGRSQLPV